MSTNEPTWNVSVVFTDDQAGNAVAHTTGLTDHLGFELLTWAKPTDAGAVDADWSLTPDDLGLLLNGLAFDVLEGKLSIGDSTKVEFDRGDSLGLFNLHTPTLGAEFGAAQIAERQASAVRWEMHRITPAPKAPLSPEAGAVLTRAAVAFAADIAALPASLAGVEDLRALAADASDVTEDRAYGPASALVARVAAHLTSLTADDLAELSQTVMGLPESRRVEVQLGALTARARQLGRQQYADAAIDLAGELLTWLQDQPRWHEFLEQIGMPADSEYASMFTHLIGGALQSTLLSATLHDELAGEERLLTDSLLLRARYEAAGDTLWHVSPTVRDSLTALLGTFNDAEVAGKFLDSMSGYMHAGDEGFEEMELISIGIARITPTSTPGINFSEHSGLVEAVSAVPARGAAVATLRRLLIIASSEDTELAQWAQSNIARYGGL